MIDMLTNPFDREHKLTAHLALIFVTGLQITSVFSFTANHHKFSPSRHNHNHNEVLIASSSAPTIQSNLCGRININDNYPGLKRVHSNPDVFIIEKFLDEASCDDLIDMAVSMGISRSPVAYAGWTEDIKDLLGLAASGPVTWLAILGAWYEAQGDVNASVLSLVMHSVRNYAELFVVAAVLIVALTKFRADGLQDLRTSSSTTLDDLSHLGARKFVSCAVDLFGPATSNLQPASYFEAPTVIRYEENQRLAPHYDANRSANVEDKNRGGQTLSTLLVYLNDVRSGGTTKFGKLPPAIDERQVKGDINLSIIPRKGDALLFFPADQNGLFDERVEHEGCPAIDEKWIARIWRHEERVLPPFGLSDDAMQKYL